MLLVLRLWQRVRGRMLLCGCEYMLTRLELTNTEAFIL